jgi:hypothetical protein
MHWEKCISKCHILQHHLPKQTKGLNTIDIEKMIHLPMDSTKSISLLINCFQETPVPKDNLNHFLRGKHNHSLRVTRVTKQCHNLIILVLISNDISKPYSNTNHKCNCICTSSFQPRI